MIHRSPLSLWLVPIMLATLAACDGPTSPEPVQESAAVAQMGRVGAAPLAVAVPFRARAFTLLESLAPDPSCGAPPRFLNRQAGEGRAAHLGRFTVTFTFCVDATDLLDDGMLTEGESLPYDNGIGMLVAANGDELYLSIEGAVLPSDDPEYDFEFRDAFEFTGGTGRFESAEGGGMTDSFVSQATDRTDHHWSGTLIMKPAH